MTEATAEYARITNGYLEIRQKVAKEGVVSSTGKSVVHVSTGGFRALPDGFSLNVVLIKKA